MDRIDGLSKLTGRERYVDDLPVDGFLWAATVRSPAPRGRVREVRYGKDVDWSQFVVVGHEDLPGPNEIQLIERDQPVLAGERVRHVHEAVALLAHPDRNALRRALRAVEVVVDSEPGILDYRKPPSPAQIQHGEDNVFKHIRIEKGHVDAAFENAAHVVEGVYETGAQEHVYLETQGMLAWTEGDVVVVQGSMQCPYYVLKSLTHALGRGPEQVRVIQAPTGGGFGGKEDFPSNVAIHAAVLALKAGRPIKLIYDRGEDMAATTKRHPSRVRHRTALDQAGRLLAQDIEVLMDGGAYVTLSPVVLSRGVIHAAGPYSCDHVRIDGKVVLSNTVPFGAFRGFGAPQTLFATERHMDRIAQVLGMDPVELRRINLIRDGQSTATGQTIDDRTASMQPRDGLGRYTTTRRRDTREAVLEKALKLSDFFCKREEHAAFNATHPWLRRGVGLACFYHGAGFTGAGELYLKSRAHVRGLPDGRVEVLTANTEMGQGAFTVFVRVAADRLGLEADQVLIGVPDTFRVPDSGPTVASRTAMIVGHLVEGACDDLRRKLELDEEVTGKAFQETLRAWHRKHPGEDLVGEAQYEQPPHIRWDENAYRGDAYGTFAWAAYVAEVEVDLRTGDIRVTDFVAVQEIGRVLHETLARGQIQGGVVQALGWAIMEDCRYKDGAMVNNQLTNYIIPTSDDVPPIRVLFLENPYKHGAQGAKGIGELPMDGPAPAVANAVAAATGTDPCAIPLTPERLLDLIMATEKAVT